jgi:hypothetical protein
MALTGGANMETLARQVGETLVARGTAAAISRWGIWRVAGWLGVAALLAYYFSSRYRTQHAAPQLPAPEAGKDASSSPDVERRRVPDFESHQDESRTLH